MGEGYKESKYTREQLAAGKDLVARLKHQIEMLHSERDGLRRRVEDLEALLAEMRKRYVR